MPAGELKDEFPVPTPRMRWVGTIFFVVIHLVGFIGTPIYIATHDVTAGEWILFFSYIFLTGFSITVGYHRLFAHSTFKTVPFIKFLLLFFGAATFEQSALKWSSQHRQHHRFTDTEQDPYSINKGFWYAHVGWILFWKHTVNHSNVQDLVQDKMVVHQHRKYGLWSMVSGIVLPIAIGIWMDKLVGVLIMTISFRLAFVLNAAFFINSYCHTFGSRPYDKTISARDHWLGAFLTNGEGYHNYHHKFPGDYRNGIRWYHWDPTKWIIFLLSKLNLAWDLRTVPDTAIEHARKTAAAS